MSCSPFKRCKGFTLIEILIVILIIGIIMGIALPAMLHTRANSAAVSCRENLRTINHAKERWAMENNKPDTAVPAWNDIVPSYLKGTQPACPAGGTYTIGSMSSDPTCSIGGGHTIQ